MSLVQVRYRIENRMAACGIPIHPVMKTPSKDHGSSSTTLHRSGYILLVVLIYISLAIFAWVVLCLLTTRPLSTPFRAAPNGYNLSSSHLTWDEYMDSPKLRLAYQKSAWWYSAVRIVQSIVTMSTLPVTTAVCSKCGRHLRSALRRLWIEHAKGHDSG